MLSDGLDRLVGELLAQDVNAPRNAVVHLAIPSKNFTYEKAVGVARPDSGAPMSPDHSFHWASIAKTTTAILILQLWEEGYFGDDGLNRPLQDLGYLPDALVDGLHSGGQLTLRHLLCHTGGIKDAMQDGIEQLGAEAGGLAPDSLLGQWFFNEKARAQAPHPMIPWDAAADEEERFAGVINFYRYQNRYAKTALFKPGEGFHYSDTGYVLLGLLIEFVTKKPLHQNLEERIFKPLALGNIYLAYRNDPALGSCRDPESEIYFGEKACLSTGMDLSFDWGGGGIVSTARTLNSFFQGLLSGKLFSHSHTLAEMTSWQQPKYLESPRTGVGLGIFRAEYPGGELWGHSGAWGAKMFWDPSSDIYLTGTINQAMGDSTWHWPIFEYLKSNME